jgi:hypothetical protein
MVVLALVLAVGIAVASGGGTKLCIPTKANKTVKTPKSGESCASGSTLTELGAEGKEGKQGPEGKEGKTGPAGLNSPLVYGPFKSVNDPDSGECSSEWAKDTYTRTYSVTPLAEGSEPHGPGGFYVTALVKGTFTTIPGAEQPGASPCGPTIEKAVTGRFYGDLVIHIGPEAEFNPEASYSSEDPGLIKSTEEFVEAYFPGQTGLGSYAWQFHYRTNGLESWDNTDHGNKGNIEGKH